MPLPATQLISVDNHLEAKILKLLAYCQANDWAGYDPYDAVNSQVFTALPFLNARLPRLVLTQALKRSPINIRRLLRIPKTQNPKAIAVFLSAFLKLSRIGVGKAEEFVELMIERLIALRSQGFPYWCWGYSFPWQTRTIAVPTGVPNLVCTTFVGNALLDTYEQRQDERCLSMAVSTAEYILDELYWTDGKSLAGFSYPLPGLRNQVPNANFLGAAFLCRVYKHTSERRFLDPAVGVARCAAAMQHPDGSWDYGEGQSQRWIDNFHTSPLAAMPEQCSSNRASGAGSSSTEPTFSARTAHPDIFITARTPWTFTPWRRASSRSSRLRTSTRAMSIWRVRYSNGQWITCGMSGAFFTIAFFASIRSEFHT